MWILITGIIIYNCDEEAVIKVVPIYHMIITSSTCSESSLIYKRVRKDSLDPQGTFEACTQPEAVANNFSNDPNFSRDWAKYIQGRASCGRDTLHTLFRTGRMKTRAPRSSFLAVSHPDFAHVIINRLITVDKNRKDTVLSRARRERGCFIHNLLV